MAETLASMAGGRRAKGRIGWLMREVRAQGTVEYALTLVALMAMVSALALLWRAGEDGVFARLAEEAASHALGGTGPIDIALF